MVQLRGCRRSLLPCLVLLVPLLAPTLNFSAARHSRYSRFVGAESRSRELQVARFSDLNPAAEASREAATLAIKAVPFTSAPGDLFGGAVQIIIIPFFVGVFIVYLVTVFKPDAILTDDQLVEYKKAEKQYFLEKRGAVKDPDAPAEMNRAGRRAARSLKDKRRTRSRWAKWRVVNHKVVKLDVRLDSVCRVMWSRQEPPFTSRFSAAELEKEASRASIYLSIYTYIHIYIYMYIYIYILDSTVYNPVFAYRYSMIAAQFSMKAVAKLCDLWGAGCNTTGHSLGKFAAWFVWSNSNGFLDNSKAKA